jgi:exodeoxyribonuclease V gamma subunit
MLEVHHSNRLETLIEALVEVTDRPLSDPFAAEVIVVQNQGMARWIAQQTAESTGIGARLTFALPASFFWQVLQAWLPHLPETAAFDKEALLWRLLRLLPERLDQPAFAPLQRYLATDDSDLRLYQLVRRVADLFDQYLVYRSDLVLAWEAGSEDHWQAILWRALCAESGSGHRAQLLVDLERAMASGVPASGVLPERVSLFGLTALAPVYVNLLGALARFIPVNIFNLNPCRGYWADLIDERGQARRRACAQKAGLPDPTGLLDVGNPLLASLGHAGQVLLDQLLEQGGQDHDRFEAPAADHLLAQVQRDLLDLEDPRLATGERLIASEDASIQIHSAHSRLREIQILHDRLLGSFERLNGLEPRDIIVMAPDIDLYAPYVEAVFGAGSPGQHIPWSIADRRLGAEQPLAEALRVLLALPRSRLEAAETLSLLQIPPVCRRFGLDLGGIERIRSWVRESGIRWGADAAMRTRHGLPPEDANTWSFGLDRLFLGYALPPDSQAEPYSGILPYVDIEGGEAVDLGRLQSFLESLTDWQDRLTVSLSLREWRVRLNELMASFLAPDEDEEPLAQAVRDRLDEVAAMSEGAGFDGPLSLDVVRALLDAVLDESAGAQRFMTGRVTFCNMVPMRSIPFRVVCLIGMNGTDFPRNQRPLSFDLMAQAPRRGDRSRRRDDRYLFLEAILSARDILYLSYVGNDQRDNSLKVPSVVVSELLDYLGEGYRLADGPDPTAHLCVHHPLQPFSRTYFDGHDPRLASYARLWLAAAHTIRETAIPAFAAQSLGPPDDALRTLDIEDLIRFLRNPARAFLIERLGLRLPVEDEVPEDAEPFDLAPGLERYALRQSLLTQLLDGGYPSTILTRLRGEGVLPHGAPGELVLDEQLAVAQPFVDRLERYAGERLEPLEVDLWLGGFRLQGQLRQLQPDGLLEMRFGKLRAKDRLAVWVRHLVLNAMAPEHVGRESRFLAEDVTLTLSDVTLADVEGARALLLDLLELRWRGLHAPLAFFPESAFAWLESGEYGAAFEAAWSGERNYAPESADAAVRIAFRGCDPIDAIFEATARRILQPMLACSSQVKAGEDR